MNLPHTDEGGCNEAFISIEVSSIGAGARNAIKTRSDELLAVLKRN